MSPVRPSFVIALVAALVAAGCLGKAEPVETAAADDAVPEVPDAGAAAPEASAEPLPSVETSIPIAWSGKTRTGVCAPSGVNSCSGRTLTDGDWFHAPEVEGVPLRVDLTLTWSAQTALTQEMEIVVSAAKSCGDGCWSARGIGSAVGPSPLALALDALPLEADEYVLILVHTPGLHQDPVYARAELEQEFEMVGTLVAQVPATGEAGAA